MPKLGIVIAILLTAGLVLLLEPTVRGQIFSGSKREVAPREDLHADEQKNIKIFEESSPSAVHITTITLARSMFSFNIMQVPQGTGTGLVWDKQGHIVTNFHVIQEGDIARVTLADHSTWKAKLVGFAAEKDLAVLKIDAPADKLRPIPLGTSHDLRVGQNVYAIGNPFGLDQTLTTGIISALGREIDSVAKTPIRDVIQTDAAINPGNSGGPLLDSSGRLIGVNTAIFSPSGAYAGIGFAIPVDTLSWVIPDLISFGKIKRPSLGLTVASDQINYQLGLPGALILSVEKNGPADLADLKPSYRNTNGGIKLGDIILDINGKPIKSSLDVRREILSFKVGDEITVTVLRDNKNIQKKIKLKEAQGD